MNRKKTNPLVILKNGILDENPAFRLLLGMCPTLAITTAAVNGIGMGLAATFVLVGSNVVVSLLRNFIPPKVRIPAFVVIIATFVTIVQLVLKAFVPALDKALGLYIPLIVVNCIIIARSEAFAYKNPVGASFLDGIAMGVGFTIALVIVAAIREILGKGEIFGVSLFGESFLPAAGMSLPVGGFITLGLVIGLINKITMMKKKKGAH
jgi:electron transport complex protein RnfE